MRIYILALAYILVFLGCATTSTESVAVDDVSQESSLTQQSPVPETQTSKSDSSQSNQLPDLNIPETSAGNMSTSSYDDFEEINVSLLKSDQSPLSESALEKILSSRVVLPRKGHLAIMKFPGPNHTASAHFGSNYFRSESYLKTQSIYIETLSEKLEKSDRIIAVTSLPNLLAPMDAGIPMLREAAVRLQADLLLAFRFSSDIYNQSATNSVKAFCTVEAVLMDIRTGLIPYTTVVTRDNEQEISDEDIDLNEVRIRAETNAVFSSLTVVADEITEFLQSVP